MQKVKYYRVMRKAAKSLRKNQNIGKCIREKQTFLLTRHALFKNDINILTKYSDKVEQKFEENWAGYEGKLEKYLVGTKDLKDWILKKDDTGTQYWLNINTLKTSQQHPGEQIY